MNKYDIAKYYRPQPVQRKFHKSLARYPLMEGGRGGGKSLALLWEAIWQCILVPGSNSLLLRRTITAAQKGGIEDHFLKYVPRDFYWGFNGSSHCVTFDEGSKLFFGHIRNDQDLAQYQSSEFLFIGWDELTQFSYSQWDYVKGSNRCPIKLDKEGQPVRARMAGATNPNGIGSGWVKALWITKQPPAGEMMLNYDPNDYEAIHSTYEDNKIYVNDAEYIAGLASISDPALRAAWIPGDWNILAGQFFQNWDLARHVRAYAEIDWEDWQERWISIDWGFAHASAVLWFTRANITDGFGRKKNVIVCYRELVVRGHNEALLAEKIGRATPETERIAHVYLSPDRFNRSNEEHTIADRLGDELRQFDIPRPERANNERVGGWRLVYTLLDTDGFVVLDTCRDVIESVPKLQRDEKNLEDARKEGNELFLDVDESLRYGLMSYASKAEVPREVEMDRRIKSIKDPTAKYMEYLRLQNQNRGSDIELNVPGPALPGRR